MTGSCLICSRCIEALLNAKLLELLESSLFFVCEMAKVTLESGLGFGGLGRGGPCWSLGTSSPMFGKWKGQRQHLLMVERQVSLYFSGVLRKAAQAFDRHQSMTRIIQHLRLKPEDRFRVLSNMARELSFSRFSRLGSVLSK